MSGTATRVGLGGLSELVGDATMLLLGFVAGAATSVLLVARSSRRGAAPAYWLPLVLMSALLGAIAFTGRAGWFGPFDVTDEVPWGMLLPLAFSMGLLNAAVTTATGAVVRSTHVTGPATDLGVSLGLAIVAGGDARARELEAALLRAGKVVGFIVGAAAAVPIAGRIGYLAFLPPAAVILLVTALSFRRAPSASASWVPIR